MTLENFFSIFQSLLKKKWFNFIPLKWSAKNSSISKSSTTKRVGWIDEEGQENRPLGYTMFLSLEQSREKWIQILCHQGYINVSGPHLLLPLYFWSIRRTQKSMLHGSIAASTWNPTPCSDQQKILKQNENLEGERCVQVDLNLSNSGVLTQW